jgi:thiamine biosynthesis lipoprotein
VIAEESRSFECFGGLASVHVAGSPRRGPGRAAAEVEALLFDAHRRLSRFLPGSELSRLNRDPRPTVPASSLLMELASAAHAAGDLSDGLVDATLLDEIERAGYGSSMDDSAFPPEAMAAPDGARALAAASPSRAWSKIAVDDETGTISRPPGVKIDSGGIAKGLLADLAAATLGGFGAFAVDCCGDVRIGGRAQRAREVLVADPAGGEPIHAFALAAGGVATSGIGKRCWTSAAGEPRHHLLDPRSGRPAFTGIVQATALAPSAFLAEVHSKWALLSGPELGPARLPYGGVLVHDDGSVVVVSADPRSVAEAA